MTTNDLGTNGGSDTSSSLSQSPTSPAQARTGREKQRYDEHEQRLVAGCIPVRGNPNVEGGVEVLMVSNKHNDGLIFPKGGWETDETAEEAAARESMEEAGVRGTCVYVGEFKFKSRKKALNASGLKGGCLARVFVMDVTEEMTEWPEQKKRTRRWMPAADAIEICKHDWMRDALRTWASTVPGLSSLVAT